MKKRRRHLSLAGKLLIVAIVLVLAVTAVIAGNMIKGKKETAVSTSQQTFEKEEKTGIEEQETKQSQADDVSSITAVVNKKHPLPMDYVPSDLRVVNTEKSSDWMMREEAATALEKMFQNAKEEGITLIACSGYRSAEYQKELYDGYVSEYGADVADTISSRPGYSDHQTGLAMDIGDHDRATVFTEAMSDTPEGIWLYEHAHEYGFVIRFPKGKEDITGYAFEPWHYRYVGVTVATEMYKISPDETLEEYMQVSGGNYQE